jgi:hypothetical protein
MMLLIWKSIAYGSMVYTKRKLYNPNNPMEGKLGMLLFKILQEYKWQSNHDFAEPFPLAAVRAFEVVL